MINFILWLLFGALVGWLASIVMRTDAQQGALLTLAVRRRWRWGWVPVARIELRERADVNQEALAFSPFRDGRGIVPRGLVHALRRRVYPSSQRARPRR